jgi:2',3'-cyclic-nucleotide 2'-phosphodiesterase (5'-nucleotidase family)
LRAAGADAVIVAGHMGFKAPGVFRDDFANRVSDITKSVPGIDVFVGAHTHRDIPTEAVNRVPYTQANYYGIHLGRVDLTFHVETRRLIERRVFTVLMDGRYEPDPAVLSLVKDELELSKRELERPIGTVTEALSAESAPGRPSDQQRLIGRAIIEALAVKGVTAEAVLHGSFSDEPIEPGDKTIADVWEFMPYENFVVTAELTREDLLAVIAEAFAAERYERNLLGMTVRTAGTGARPQITDILDGAGRPLAPDRRVTVAINSYDAQSGGQRLPRLHEIVNSNAAKARFHDVETRDAVVEFFLRHKSISRKLLEG